VCAGHVPLGAVVVCGDAFAKLISALVRRYGSGGSSHRAHEPLARRGRRHKPIPACGFGTDVTGLDSRAAGSGISTGRARGTAFSYYGELRVVGVFWSTVVVSLASARAGVRLGVSTAAALWRTGTDSRGSGRAGRRSTAERARGWPVGRTAAGLFGVCAGHVPLGAVVVCGDAFAKLISALVRRYGSGGSSHRAHEPLARRGRRHKPIPACGFGTDVTGLDSRAAGSGISTGRARGTAFSYYGELRVVGVFWSTVVVSLASARAGVRLGVSTAAALWRTVSDSVLAGGGSRTAVRARVSGLLSCAFVGTICSDEGSAAGGVRARTRFLDGDVAICGVYGRGDDVARFGLARSLVGRRRR